MIQTFIALLFAHACADFLFQTRWMVENKTRAGVLLLHGALVLVLAQAALGHVAALPVLLLALAHLVIDAVKTWSGKDGLAAYLVDQSLHLVTIAGAAYLAPGLWQTGFWATTLPGDLAPALPRLMLIGAGLIIASRAGSFAIVKLMQAHALDDIENDQGLPGGGATIGYLERTLIYILVLSGQIAAIGFLVAAKSILRFGTVSGDRKATEYVIIGTLFSFGWALLAGLAVTAVLQILPPLEIAPPSH